MTSFLHSAGVPIAYNPSLTPAEKEPVGVASRRVPTRVQLRRLVDSLTLRDRVIVLTLASSGMRVGVIASDDRSDGLRMENLPGLDLKTGEFKAKPPLVSVTARLSQNGKPYMTALSSGAAGVVEIYLARRLASGEKFAPRSPLFVPSPEGTDREARSAEGYRTLNRNPLANVVSEGFDKVAPAGMRWTAHTLRKWCSSRLESAESRGLISRTRREFFLGRTLGVDGRYNLDRPLSEEAQNGSRGGHRKVESFLEVMAATKPDTKADPLSTFAASIETAAGKKADGSLREEDLAEALRDALQGSPGEPETASAPTVALVPVAVPAPKRAGERQIILESDLRSFLDTGGVAKMPVNHAKCLVEWNGSVPQ